MAVNPSVVNNLARWGFSSYPQTYPAVFSAGGIPVDRAWYALINAHRFQVTVAVYPERTDAMNGAGIRRINCDRIACREGHFERLVETRIERLFGLGFLGHAA